MKYLVSLRPNYYILIGYLKRAGLSVPHEPPLDPPLSFQNLILANSQLFQQVSRLI